MRLKSKLNFILVSQKVKDERPSVSYYSSSNYSESDNSESSLSVHSNRRYISYLDKDGEENADMRQNKH